MKYQIEKYININLLVGLMEYYYKLTGIAYGFVDIDGNILGDIGWSNICTCFHRKNKNTAARCLESDSQCKNLIDKNDKYVVYKCRNGLMEAFVPIYIEDTHVANLFIGQMLFEEPDIEYFKAQAREFGFNEDEYIRALKEVPIIKRKELDIYMDFYTSLAAMISNVMNNNYKTICSEEKLKTDNQKLESTIKEKTNELKVKNTKLEHLEKTNEELNQNLNYERLRTEFFSNISHEFRTPLNIIYSATKMVDIFSKNDNKDEGQKKLQNYINMIEQNCFRLMKLVNNILDINKFDYDSVQINLSKFNIVNVIENTVTLIVDYAKNKNISLVFDTEEEEIITMCDTEKIERVMFNLLSNAIKFTEPGGKISVMVSYNDNKVVISVKDTGKGIPEDKLNTIFEKFTQVDKSFTRDHEGSGLGLFIVKSIIEMHGGDIRVESILGKGSNFIINLPVKIMEDNINNVQVFSANPEMLNIEFSDI